jgi:uncharacterized protein (DUF983 family)
MENAHAAVSPLSAALKCCCPRCGKGHLFVQLLNMRERCESCGLDYAFINTGDGPAVFAIFILGFLCMGGAPNLSSVCRGGATFCCWES